MNAQPSMWKGLLLPESKMSPRTRKRSTHPTRVFAASSRAGNAATSSRSQSLMLKLRTKVFVKKLITSNTRFHRGLRRAR